MSPQKVKIEDVLVALTGTEDEETVPEVVGDPRDEHDPDHCGPGQRRREPDDQQGARAEFGEARRPGVDDPGAG